MRSSGATPVEARSEKITINMGAVDLGRVDILIQEGVYTNRTDFIRTAIRNQLDRHVAEVQQSVARNAYVVGVLHYNRDSLERLRKVGKKVRLTLLGMLSLADDISPELARETIESLRIRGIFHARDEVKRALADRRL